MNSMLIIAMLGIVFVGTGKAQNDTTYSGQSLKVYVKGMSCPSCARSLNLLFHGLPSIKSVKVEVSRGLLHLLVKKDQSITRKEIQDRIKEAGFSLDRIETVGGPEASLKFKSDITVEMFSAECKLCQRTLNLLKNRFPGLSITVHKASECVDGSCCILAEKYGVRAVPSIVVNGKLIVSGVPDETDLVKLIEMIR